MSAPLQESRPRPGPPLDLIAGWGAYPFGLHPMRVIRAAIRQMARPPEAFSDGARHGGERSFAKLLASSVGWPEYTALPATTGGEALDLALRLARRHTNRLGVAFLSGSFHGNSLAAAALCGIPGWQHQSERRDWSTIAIDVAQLEAHPFEAITLLERECARKQIGCLVFEPLRVNAGFARLTQDAMAALLRVCQARGLLVIADEVASGLGRAGAWLACEHYSMSPDLIVVGKALGAGVYPVAAVLARPEIAAHAGRGFRSTYAWTPTACAVGLTTLRALRERSLPQRAFGLRKHVAGMLERIAALPLVTAITGSGLAIGIRLTPEASPTLRLSLQRQLEALGLLVGVSPVLPGLVMMPPLTIRQSELCQGLTILHDVLERWPLANAPAPGTAQ